MASRRHLFVIPLLGLAACSATRTASDVERPITPAHSVADYHLVPWPAEIVPGAGYFRLDASARLLLSDPGDPELQALAAYLAEALEARGVAAPRLSRERARGGERNAISLVLAAGAAGGAGGARDAEAYELRVDAGRIVIEAADPAGLFYGIQTLRQLVPPPAAHAGQAPSVAVPAAEIRDRPRFVYRGMHLDVGRHLYPVSFIKRYIDLLAMYKMNTFHWHLTEDQGWRIEIESYPRLTRVGGFRKETILDRNFDPYIGDRKPYGGFYTQDEVREVVEHARSRFVTVIPEIEMPGHSTAALAAYPELACTDGPFEVATVWGVHEDIYCPSERTFAFLQDVLTEVMQLFPSRYIHIGGDEAPKARWEESEIAQEVMRREGLADEHELQSYFVRRIEGFLLAHDRRLIGWDEILEGGLAPEATVMSWRGTAGGIEAARQGHDVIMTPTSHVYFDYYQGDPRFEPLAIGGLTPLRKVYGFEPVPDVLTAGEAQHVLGAQGNVWTEYMKTPSYVEYMVFPRLLALAEVVWSPRGSRSWERFVANLPWQFDLLDGQGVNYRVPHVRGLETDRISLDETLTVELSTLVPGATIRYTLDGSDPGPGSPLYRDPLRLTVDSVGLTVTARAFLANGRPSPPRAAHFARTTLRAAAEIAPETTAPGLRYAYYEARLASVDSLADATASEVGVTKEIGLAPARRDENFGLEFSGYLQVPTSGVYSFELTSDDGSALSVGDVVLVDLDGYHGPTTRSGMIALQAGLHPISVRYFQAGGGSALRLAVRSVDDDQTLDLDGRFFHRP